MLVVDDERAVTTDGTQSTVGLPPQCRCNLPIGDHRCRTTGSSGALGRETTPFSLSDPVSTFALIPVGLLLGEKGCVKD